MDNTNWAWASLNDTQLQHVAEAENTLGADYLLVYQSDRSQTGPAVGSSSGELQVASLTPSQLECLQGLENQLQAVVVAYNKSEQ
jgi:hypothetical protein